MGSQGYAPEQGAAEGGVEQEVVGEVAEDVSEQVVAQDATSSSTTPVSRKTDPLSDTELRKDLGGSELPTSVRLSPHDIHTEITFISDDEVDVQLSLAEGAPTGISVRALAAQLTGDDAVRIEILDLPEGLRFDRETGMLEDILGSGLSADGVAEVRVMLTDAQGRRMTVTLQVLSAEGLSQPEAETRLEGRTLWRATAKLNSSPVHRTDSASGTPVFLCTLQASAAVQSLRSRSSAVSRERGGGALCPYGSHGLSDSRDLPSPCLGNFLKLFLSRTLVSLSPASPRLNHRRNPTD